MFGEILQELRKDKGWKQSDLAGMLGLSKSAIGSYEAEISEPSFDNLIKISELFNVNIDYLLGHSRESIIWNDIAGEIQTETGSVSMSKINEMLRSLELRDRTAVIEHLMKLKRLQQFESAM